MMMAMADMTTRFRERGLLVPQCVMYEEMKMKRCHNMLCDNIREFVIMLGCRTLEDMIDRA